MRRKTTASQMAKMLRITPARGMGAVMKAQLISAVLKAAEKRGLTHQELAKRSKLSRSVVTGILSGSLQRVTIRRVLQLVEAAGLEVQVKVSKAA